MSGTSRLDALKAMLANEPDDPTLRYMLANEYFNAGMYEETIEEIGTYLDLKSDEGAVYRTLALALEKLGKRDEAKQAYLAGIQAARRHGHPSMVEEYEASLRDMDSDAL